MENKTIPKTAKEWYIICRLECLFNVRDSNKAYARSIDIASTLGCKTRIVNYHLGKLVKEGLLRKEFCRWWTEYYLI